MVAISCLVTDRLRYVMIVSIPDIINHRELERKLFLKKTYGEVLNLKLKAIIARERIQIMKSAGNYEYCYNGQISVDSKSQIMVGQHLTQNVNDKKEPVRAVDEIKNSTDRLPEKVGADSGYLSSDNIVALEDSKVDGYIATGKGEKDLSKIADKKNRQEEFFI